MIKADIKSIPIEGLGLRVVTVTETNREGITNYAAGVRDRNNFFIPMRIVNEINSTPEDKLSEGVNIDGLFIPSNIAKDIRQILNM